jgi:Zn-dependent oligopeptidase
MVDALKASKNMFGALEMQQQIMYALMDQRYHSAEMRPVRRPSSAGRLPSTSCLTASGSRAAG